MNKKSIIETIKKYNLNKNEFYVISGAALVLLDITESTKDIDICVNENYQNYLLNKYNCKLERINEFGKPAYMIDEIINFGVSFKPKEYVIIDDIKVSSLKDCYELKAFLNRKKDEEIIKQLKLLLK